MNVEQERVEKEIRIFISKDPNLIKSAEEFNFIYTETNLITTGRHENTFSKYEF